MPQTTAPLIWLAAVLALMMRPAAIALTTRVTRTMPSFSLTRTSQNTAECTARAYLRCLSICGVMKYFSST